MLEVLTQDTTYRPILGYLQPLIQICPEACHGAQVDHSDTDGTESWR
jgi:hypothetical protein